MWPAFHTERPIEELVVKDSDMRLATLAFGWTLGFGYFVTWHCIQQTRRPTTFIIMCWLEILVCAIFAIICWLYLCGIIKYSFWFYFTILTTWALQVQFLLQIIVNRICILLSTPRQRFLLKFIVAFWITAINISVYCIWVPAKLQISGRYHDINVWWDRIEKVLYLITDAILNFMFIRSIRQRLLKVGLKKYDKLVRFNEKIIAVSLSMDVLIITMMSYPNDFVYMQFHPVAYMVKLEIEMCMSKLMVKVATGTGIMVYEGESLEPSRSKSSKDQSHSGSGATHFTRSGQAMSVRVATHTVTHRDQHDLEGGNDVFDNNKGRRMSAHRVSAIEWQHATRSEPIELEEYKPDPSAQDDDEQSNGSKCPQSWVEEPYTPHSNPLTNSALAIKDADVDLERGDARSDDEEESEPTGGVTVSYLGAFPNHSAS